MEFAMENGLTLEQNTLINELTQGMELAKQLRAHLNPTSSNESRELLLQKILSSYEKALLILKWSGSMGNPQSLAPVTGLPESSVSGDGSPRSDDFDRGFKDHLEQSDVSKKRKLMPTWTDHVRVCSENGLEGPMEDGYSWRKYGQKDILGAKYPRSYYRCTYRSTQNCWATKQVQRSDDDPTVFEITYKGKHTCSQNHHTSPLEKQQPKQNNNGNSHQQPPPENLLFNLRTSLRVSTDDLDNKEVASNFTFPHSASFKWMNGENQNLGFSTLVNDHTLGSYSPSFISPATSETNYYSVPPFQMNNMVHNFQHSESEIISATTSATNSPIGDLDFSIDLDPNFPFNSPGFFN
ncbi:hypothetical protein C3L33_08490, partial [Rhododendron williamsianum]